MGLSNESLCLVRNILWIAEMFFFVFQDRRWILQMDHKQSDTLDVVSSVLKALVFQKTSSNVGYL